MEIPEQALWRTPTGIHHVSGKASTADNALDFDIDSIAFAQKWNVGWSGRSDLKGRVVVGFQVPSRNDVDTLYDKLTGRRLSRTASAQRYILGPRYAIVEDPDGIAVGLMRSRFPGIAIATSGGVLAQTPGVEPRSLKNRTSFLTLTSKSKKATMRITSKGQVTIPVEIREKAGLLPHTEVDFEFDGKVVRIVRAKARNGDGRGARLVAHLRGRGDVAMSTDAIMALTRDD